MGTLLERLEVSVVVAPMAGGATTRELAPQVDARVVRLAVRWKRACVGIRPCGARERTAGADRRSQPSVVRSILVDLVRPTVWQPHR
jgi:hypothetical protein